jgi:hypothetical protein
MAGQGFEDADGDTIGRQETVKSQALNVIRLWLLWMAATTLSITVGWVVANVLAFLSEVGSPYHPTVGDDTERFILGCFVGPVLLAFLLGTI